MSITIQSVHFDADKKLIDFVNEKVSKLNQYYEGIIGSEVILKIDKASDNLNKIAEIKLLLRGNELFAKKQCSTFEEAVDTTVVALRSQLIRYKEKKELAK
ncbi:MAG: ribosome-associated translation inhibitor RaiA [Bacteroidia bacterium]|nr:ribosome-associated translation inhibitor RaiA [Bacteroidia bacterium]